MSKRILILAMHRPGRSPGQRFRFEQYIGALEADGWECDVSHLISEADDRVLYAPGQYVRKGGILARSIATRLGDVVRARRYDVVFIYREALMVNTAVIERLLARTSARLVFDFDDAIWIPAVSEGNEAMRWIRGAGKIDRILGMVDLVMAGNDYLADHARAFNANVHVIPTTIDTDLYAPPAARLGGPVRIGWSGSPSTAPYFDALVPALARVQERFGDGVEVRMFGDGRYTSDVLGIEGVAWTRESEPAEVSQMDIGIMPLPDDAWARGKCGFKALLYMAFGVPAVVSPVGVNTDIVRDGENGMLARTDDEWVARLSALVEDAQLRERLGAAGRETVVASYSVRAIRERYLFLLNTLVSG